MGRRRSAYCSGRGCSHLLCQHPAQIQGNLTLSLLRALIWKAEFVFQWGYCSNTVVYEFTDNAGATQVAFWDVKNMELHKKKLPSSTPLMLIAAEGEYCCLALKQGSSVANSSSIVDSARRDEFTLVLYNSIGTPLESKTIYFGKIVTVKSSTFSEIS